MWKKTADIMIRAALLASIASVNIAPATIAFAQTVDHPRGDNDKDKGGRDISNDGRGTEHEMRLNRPTTSKIVLDLASVRRECGGYDEVYRIDCLRQGIDMIVSSLPDNSEYRDAKLILKQTSSRLARIVTTYQDTAAPRLEVPADANPRFKKRRKYTAIQREAVPEAMAKAQKAVEEATTALLRSSENSQRRYVHYQEISVAVDSTKTLLRSS